MSKPITYIVDYNTEDKRHFTLKYPSLTEARKTERYLRSKGVSDIALAVKLSDYIPEPDTKYSPMFPIKPQRETTLGSVAKAQFSF
jgi:hypothetical protein|nr:MAG TPA: hypothetical protein [Caudoviricetes sp.]